MRDEKYIPIQIAASRSQVSEEKLADLIEKKELSCRIIEKTIYVDYSELERYIEARSRLSIYKVFADEVKILLSFTPNSSPPKTVLEELTTTNSQLYNHIINEFSLLIHAKTLRSIFIDRCSGKSYKELSVIYNYTPQHISNLFAKSLNIIGENIGIIKRYADQNEELKLELRKQQILHNSYLNALKIKNLNDSQYKDMIRKGEEYARNSHQHLPDISKELILKLSENLSEWDISTRLENIFKYLELQTTEDLLRYIKENGFRELKSTRSCGRKTLEELIDILLEKELINEKNDSPYFKYL